MTCPELELIERRRRLSVALAVEELPERQREVVKLRVYENLKFTEVADVLACPYNTAKANYRHAVENLKKRFAGERDAG